MKRDIFLPVGRHLLADLHGIAASLLGNAAAIENALRQGALAAGAKILHSHFHTFGPGAGITGVLVLAESHISIHTWPESGFAAVDIFMCGVADPQRALAVIQAALAPVSAAIRNIARGECAALPIPDSV